MSIKTRIQSRLDTLGLTPRAASIRASLSPTFVKDILSGKSINPKTDTIIALARALETTPEYLLENRNGSLYLRCPIVGEIGAGAMLTAFSEDAFEYIDVPPGTLNVEASAVMRGDTQLPVLRDGDTIFWGVPAANPLALAGLDCVVTLGDGRRLIKTILPGSRPGLYTLSAHNAPPLIDQAVVRASHILWVKRGGA